MPEWIAPVLVTLVYWLIIWKFGIKGLWKMVKQLAHRLVDGPPKPIPGDCMHLHLTAKAEWEVYGEIKSESIQDHLKTCKVRIANMPFGKPLTTPRSNCAHKSIECEYDLAGKIVLRYCTDCGRAVSTPSPSLPGRYED